jgi:hypothetical protein
MRSPFASGRWLAKLSERRRKCRTSQAFTHFRDGSGGHLTCRYSANSSRFESLWRCRQLRSSRLLPPDSLLQAANQHGCVSEREPGGAVQPASVAAPQTNNDRYRDGIIIWETPPDAEVPFLLKFNINTQLRYLNTLSSDEEFTDHLGVVREVHRRNDITVNRAMFILGGFIFDTRLRYSFTVWTSAGASSIVVASNVAGNSTRPLPSPQVTPGFQAVDRWSTLPIFCGDR